MDIGNQDKKQAYKEIKRKKLPTTLHYVIFTTFHQFTAQTDVKAISPQIFIFQHQQ